MRQRVEVTCPICGKPFTVELEVSTYVTAEVSTPPEKKGGISLVLRGHEA